MTRLQELTMDEFVKDFKLCGEFKGIDFIEDFVDDWFQCFNEGDSCMGKAFSAFSNTLKERVRYTLLVDPKGKKYTFNTSGDALHFNGKFNMNNYHSC